jgi:hypothetical protein
MAIFVGVGSSEKKETAEAINEALAQASLSLENHSPSLLLLLASPTTYDQQQLLNLVKEKYPQTTLIGCSTSGEITNLGPKDNSLCLMAIASDQIRFAAGKGLGIKTDARQAGRDLAKAIKTQNQDFLPKVALIFPDGLAGNGADIVRGIQDVFGETFLFAGGSAGDDFLFKKTYEYFERELLSEAVVGVGLAGNFSFGIGVRHGWIPIGTSRTVTKAKSNVLYELDHKPAIQIYQDQFGKDKKLISTTEPLARLAITYPLGIVLKDQSECLIRDPITVDANGAITCAAEVPEGATVYIMIGGREEAIEAARQAAKMALNHLKGKTPKAAILFNCIARKKLLMNKKEEEIEAIKQIIGEEVPLIGFYTYGEQAPLAGQVMTCSFHNETDVLFLLSD